MSSFQQTPSSSILTWKTWFLWVVVCALEPIFYATASMAFQKEIQKYHPNSTLLFWGTTALILICLPLPIILQRSVLRRVAPFLGLWTWIGGMLLAYGVYVGSIYLRMEPNLLGHAFHRELTQTAGYETNKLAGLATMGWLPLWLKISLISTAMALIPALILGKSSNHQWYKFLVAASVGAGAATLAEQIYGLYFFRMRDQSLNGAGWFIRLNELSFRAGTGAVWGAVSAATLACLIKTIRTAHNGAMHQRPHPAAMVVAASGILLITPAFLYTISSEGASAGFPALQKAISVAPKTDITTGRTILQHTHNADFSPPRYPVVKFAPDGKSFIALSADRTLQRTDIASGAKLGQIGETLKRYEIYSADWSDDGRFFVLRTDGEEVKIPNTHYTRHRNRLRVFALPEYRLLGEFSYSEKECFAENGTSVMFERDGNSFWNLCQQYASQKKANDVVAIRVSVPAMSMLDIRHNDWNVQRASITELSRIGEDVGYSQRDFNNSAVVKIHNLSRNRDQLTLQNLADKNLAGRLTMQDINFEGKQVVLRYCGDSAMVSDPGPVEPTSPKAGHSFCRLLNFDILTGELLKKKDIAPIQGHATSRSIVVQSKWKGSSKSGQTIVKDAVTDLEVQKLFTKAQHPLSFSPDGKWLVMHTLDEKLLRIYRVER